MYYHATLEGRSLKGSIDYVTVRLNVSVAAYISKLRIAVRTWKVRRCYCGSHMTIWRLPCWSSCK